MYVLDSDDLFGAMFIVAILLIILSVPSLLLAVRASAKTLRRYSLLRAIGENDSDAIPKIMLGEWGAVNSPLSYVTMLTDEMERLGSLRSGILQAEIACVILAVLAFIPGYSIEVLICVVAVIAAVILTVLYFRSNSVHYGREYYNVMSELESVGDESMDRIYG